MSKLILGTAAFGQPYGIKGDGVPSERELERIARVAWDANITAIHTSRQYKLPKICEAIFDGFEEVRKDDVNPELFGWNGGIGLSVYGPTLIRKSLRYIQYPVNVLDHRCPGFYPGMINMARSVFLQGLLLMDELPDWVQGQARLHINFFHWVCRLEGYEYYEAALGWVLGLPEIDHVLIGVNSARQLEQLVKVKPLRWDYDFSITDELVLDPRKWPNA